MDESLAHQLGDELGDHQAAMLGIAMGIIMERIYVSDVEAFEALSRLADEQGRSKFEVASEIVATRGINGPRSSAPGGSGPLPGRLPALRP